MPWINIYWYYAIKVSLPLSIAISLYNKTNTINWGSLKIIITATFENNRSILSAYNDNSMGNNTIMEEKYYSIIQIAQS